MIFAYARVSTQDQNLDRQLLALKEHKPNQIFKEKASGTKSDRPALLLVLSMVRPGDTLVVESLSRLARSTKDLLSILDQLEKKETNLVSIKENWDFSTASGRLIRNIFISLSEFERDLLSERTKSGLEAAKKKGAISGRPKGLKPENEKKAALAHQMYHSGNYVSADITTTLGISKPTLYKYIRFHEAKLKSKK